MIVSIPTAAAREKDPSLGTKQRAADENATRLAAQQSRGGDRRARTLLCKGAAVIVPRATRVFKVAKHDAWSEACRIGKFFGSSDDARDGFIHLSELHQLRGTLARHFKGETDLVLIAFESSELGEALRWEASRNGELFPHLYAPLPISAARATHALTLDENGVPVLPADL
jgi:uncharacterized protein (DUF952 family)